MKLDKENIAKLAADSNYHAIGALPSQYKPYTPNYPVSFTEEDFFIRGFRLEEMRLLSKAASLGENGHLLRAVDNCISVPVESLTIGDFWYVMFWLRTNSFTDFPYTVTWDCNQPVFKHVDGGAILTYDREDWPDDATLDSDYIAEPCDTKNSVPLTSRELSVICLEDDFELDDPDFDYPRANIIQNIALALRDPDTSFLVPGIQWLAGNTWQDKLKKAEQNPGLILKAIELNKHIQHGVEEHGYIQCRRCRVEHEYRLQLDPLSFFK